MSKLSVEWAIHGGGTISIDASNFSDMTEGEREDHIRKIICEMVMAQRESLVEIEYDKDLV